MFLFSIFFNAVNNDAKKEFCSKEESLDVENIPMGCKMPVEVKSPPKGSCFWAEGWRSSLCTCENCNEV